MDKLFVYNSLYLYSNHRSPVRYVVVLAGHIDVVYFVFHLHRLLNKSPMTPKFPNYHWLQRIIRRECANLNRKKVNFKSNKDSNGLLVIWRSTKTVTSMTIKRNDTNWRQYQNTTQKKKRCKITNWKTKGVIPSKDT